MKVALDEIKARDEDNVLILLYTLVWSSFKIRVYYIAGTMNCAAKLKMQ